MAADWLTALALRLTGVDGLVGVMLGGSRARGDHAPDSDFDLGLYYRPPLDIGALRALATDVAGPRAELTEPSAWGPWVDGGGWLDIDGRAVDWIYRDLGRVEQAWRDAQRGSFYFHGQVGHPLGVPDFAYAGEVALGVILADPTGALAALQGGTRTYPPALSYALVRRLTEAPFLLDVAGKGARRGDTAYVAGCLFRVVGVCAHALHGRAGRWLINEKGCIAAAGRLEVAPPCFEQTAQDLLAHVGQSPEELAGRIEKARNLVAETAAACGIELGPRS